MWLLLLLVWSHVSAASSSVCGQCVPKVISFVDQDVLPLSVGGSLSLQCVPQSDSDILVECCRALCTDTCCGIVSTNQLLSCTQACVLRHRGLRMDLCVEACDIRECDRHIGEETYDTCGQCECPLEDASSCRRGCSVDVPCEDIEIRVIASTLETVWNITSSAGVRLHGGPYGEEGINRTQTISECASPGEHTFHASGTGSFSIEGIVEDTMFDGDIQASFSVASNLIFSSLSSTLQAGEDEDDTDNDGDADFNITQSDFNDTLVHGNHTSGQSNGTSTGAERVWVNSTDAVRRDRVVDLFIASCMNTCDDANYAQWNLSATRVVHRGIRLRDAISTVTVPPTTSGSHFVVFDEDADVAVDGVIPGGSQAVPVAGFPIRDAQAFVRGVTFTDKHLDKNMLIGTLNWALEGDYLESLDVSFDVSVTKCIPPSSQSVDDCGSFCNSALPPPDQDYFAMLPERNVTVGCITGEIRSAALAGEPAETLTAVMDCGAALDDTTSWSLNFSLPLPPLVWTVDATVFGKLNSGELALFYESNSGARARRLHALNGRRTGPQGAPMSPPTVAVTQSSANRTSRAPVLQRFERRIVNKGRVRPGDGKSRFLVSSGDEDDDAGETNEFTLLFEDMVTATGGRAFVERELGTDGNATSGEFGNNTDSDADNRTITGDTGDATPGDSEADDSDDGAAEWNCASHCGKEGPHCSCHLECAASGTCCADYEDTCLSASTTWRTHAPCRAQGACVVFPSLPDHSTGACAIHARKSGMLSYSAAVFDLNVTTPDRGIALALTDDTRWNRVPLTSNSKLHWSVKNSGGLDKEICLVATIASLWAYTDNCHVDGSCVSVRDDASPTCSAISFQPGALTYTGPTFINGHFIAGLPPPHINASDIIDIPPTSASRACLLAPTINHESLVSECTSACTQAFAQQTCPLVLDCAWDKVTRGGGEPLGPCNCTSVACWNECHGDRQIPHATLWVSVPYGTQSCHPGPLIVTDSTTLSYPLHHTFATTMTHFVITPRTALGLGQPTILPIRDLKFHLTDLHFLDVDYDAGEIAGAFSWSLSFPFEFGVTVTFTVQLIRVDDIDEDGDVWLSRNDDDTDEEDIQILRHWTSEWDAQRHILVPYNTPAGNFTHFELIARTGVSVQRAHIPLDDRELVIDDAHWVDLDPHGDEIGGRLQWTTSLDHHPDFAYDVRIVDHFGEELYSNHAEDTFVLLPMDTPWEAQMVSIVPVVGDWSPASGSDVFTVALVDTDTIPPVLHVHWEVVGEKSANVRLQVQDGSFPAPITCRLQKNDTESTNVWGFADYYGMDWYNVTRDNETILLKVVELDPFFEYSLHCTASDRYENVADSTWGPFSTPFVCGSGFLFKGSHERCDDNNRREGDGCDERCLVEEYWVCRNGTAMSRSICKPTLAIIEVVFSLTMDFGGADPPDADDPVLVESIREAYALAIGVPADNVWIKITVTVVEEPTARRLSDATMQPEPRSRRDARERRARDATALDRGDAPTRRLGTTVIISVQARIDCDETVDVDALHKVISTQSTMQDALPTALSTFTIFSAVVIKVFLIEAPVPNIRDSSGTCVVTSAAARHKYWAKTSGQPSPCQHIFSAEECNTVWACSFVYAPYFIFPQFMSSEYENVTFRGPDMPENRTDECPLTAFPSAAPNFDTYAEVCFCPAGQTWRAEDMKCVGEYCRCTDEGCQHAFWCDDDLPRAWNFTEWTTDDLFVGTGCDYDSKNGWTSCGHTCLNQCLKVPTRDQCDNKWACQWVE